MMYLNPSHQEARVARDTRSNDQGAFSKRARLVTGISGYQAQCHTLSPLGATPSHERMGGIAPIEVGQSLLTEPSNRSADDMRGARQYALPSAERIMEDTGLTPSDYDRGRKRLYRSTIRRMRPPLDRYASRILAKNPAISPAKFFKAYWHHRCKYYASELAAKAGLTRGPSVLAGQIASVKRAARRNGGAVGPMQHRFTHHRGMTVSELSECADLPIGAAVHVKVQFEQDSPYHLKDDFHHWVTYVGNGKFMDSGRAAATGEQMDAFLRCWLNRSFHQKKYAHLHRTPYGSYDQKQAKWIPAADLQPKVTEVVALPRATTKARTKKERR